MLDYLEAGIDSSVQLIFFWEIFHFEIETIVYLEMHDRPDKCKVIDPSWHAHISFSWVAVVAQLGNHRIWPTILRNWLVSYTGHSDDSSSKSPFPYFRRTFRSRISLFFVDREPMRIFTKVVETFMIFLKNWRRVIRNLETISSKFNAFRFFSRRYIMSTLWTKNLRNKKPSSWFTLKISKYSKKIVDFPFESRITSHFPQSVKNLLKIC